MLRAVRRSQHHRPRASRENQMTPKHPDIHVQLTGEDGNAFFIISRVRKALSRAGVEQDEIKSFSDEAMSGDYDNVLRTAMKWVSVA